MTASVLFKHHPPVSHEARPERPDRVKTFLDGVAHELLGRYNRVFNSRLRIRFLVRKINRIGSAYTSLGTEELVEKVTPLRYKIACSGLTSGLIVESFSLLRELSHRLLGMRHYDSQLTGGLILLFGMVAEMETGEGKTLTATLPAATAALAGIPVHVISVNDYLTERDATNMRPLYEALGLSVGCVIHGQSPVERRHAYSSDITYVTNKELTFDYLRDRLTLNDRRDSMLLQSEFLHSREQRSRRLLQRGLHFAIVDEADSILIDEARTPLIISGMSEVAEEEQFLNEALEMARGLTEKDHYTLDTGKRFLRLTEDGKKQIEKNAEELGGLWSGLVRRESVVYQALTAIHLFHLDREYLIREGKIQIIDAFTGRVMADRSWEQGLHQLIELKEGCELTSKKETLAKISYQRFFRRYLHMSGMTGTAGEVAGELWKVYDLTTLRVGTNRPLQRKKHPDHVFMTKNLKFEKIVQSIEQLHKSGRPVLIGTQSVAASEELSALVHEKGLKHQVLNAKHDSEEAEIVSRAGQLGSITIATNMAGRGTDIILGEGVVALGGLHVIATGRHEAARIDRQLAGRCGRQGDPGSHKAILSFEDELFGQGTPGMLTRLSRKVMYSLPGLGQVLARLSMNRMQKKIESHHATIRRELFKQDQAQGSLLSFSGRLE
jgi:preprotein translocase subunit SecA